MVSQQSSLSSDDHSADHRVGHHGIDYATEDRRPNPHTRFGAITTVFAGATVERIESLISRKLEEELSDLAEIKEVFSFSRPGVSLVIIELRDEVRKAGCPQCLGKSS